MKVMFLVPLYVLVIGVLYHLLTKKYLNPYKLIFIFAKKGSGKSTTLTKLALRHLKRGWTVYSTDPIPGCILIPASDIGFYELKPHSLLIIDEIGMLWHSRDHKTFPREVRNWLKLQRHRRVKVLCASQSFDTDKSVRDLADEMWLLQKKFRVFCYGKRILKVLDIIEASGDSESRVVDQLKFDSVLFAFFGSRSLTFIPHWIPYFDSFAAPALPEKEWQIYELPHELRPKRKCRSRRKEIEDEQPGFTDPDL